MKKNKTDIVIIVICCVLIAACAAFFIWKMLPEKAEDTSDPTATGTKSAFTPTITYDPDFLFDFAGQDLTKYITIGEYKGLSVNTSVSLRTGDEIEEEIAKAVSMFATKVEVTDRAVAYGDLICVDLVMLADGEEVEGTDEADVFVSVTTDEENKVAPDLVGHMPGDTVYSDITEDIKANTDYASKVEDAEKVEYKITIKYISEKVIPERTDEFAKENLGFDTFAEFAESYTKKVNVEYALSNDDDLFYNIVSAVFENCSVLSVPNDYVDNMFNYYKYVYEYYAYLNGMEYDDFMKDKVGMTDDELRENVEESIMHEVMLYVIAKAEGLTATEEEIEAFAEQQGKSEGMTAEEFLEEYGREAVEEYITTNNASDFLIYNTVIVYSERTDATATKTAE